MAVAQYSLLTDLGKGHSKVRTLIILLTLNSCDSPEPQAISPTILHEKLQHLLEYSTYSSFPDAEKLQDFLSYIIRKCGTHMRIGVL